MRNRPIPTNLPPRGAISTFKKGNKRMAGRGRGHERRRDAPGREETGICKQKDLAVRRGGGGGLCPYSSHEKSFEGKSTG